MQTSHQYKLQKLSESENWNCKQAKLARFWNSWVKYYLEGPHSFQKAEKMKVFKLLGQQKNVLKKFEITHVIIIRRSEILKIGKCP